MSNSGRLIFPSELMSINLTSSSISHGGRFAISAVRSASANSTMSIVPESSTSAQSKNWEVVVPRPHNHFVNLTNSSLKVILVSSISSSIMPRGIRSWITTPTVNAIAPIPTMYPLLFR